MPQTDRHKEREIPIEFDFYNTLESLPVDNRCTIIMVSCGSATIKINEYIQTVTAPTILCISQYDNFQCLERTHLSAKAFHFDPWYIKACLKFENLDDSVPIDKQYVYDRNMLYMFTKHYRNFQGIFNLTPQQYVHLNELMLMIGAETYSQSDDYWTCRIRRMLRQTLNCIFDIYVDQCKLKFYELSENTNPVTTCTDYIHANYQNDITLNSLCELVHLNRTTLNQRFKQQLNCTCIEYLLHYRLKISQELTRILKSMILPINVVLSMVPTSTANLRNTLEFHHRNFVKIPLGIACLRAIKLKNYSCRLYLFIRQ